MWFFCYAYVNVDVSMLFLYASHSVADGLPKPVKSTFLHPYMKYVDRVKNGGKKPALSSVSQLVQCFQE